MKNRNLAVMLGIMMTFSPCTVFAQEAGTAVEAEVSDAGAAADDGAANADGSQVPEMDGQMAGGQQMQEDAVYGQITALGENSLTIAVGTMKEMAGDGAGDGQPQESASEEEMTEDGAGEEGAEQDGAGLEQPSMLDLTGEELTVGITENTVITRSQMGMGGQMGQMQGGQQGGAPGQADGGNGEAPQQPSDGSGEVPEKPEGEDGEGSAQMDGGSGEVPEKPEGENGEAPAQPDGENGEGEVPEMPEGENGEAPAQPDGENGEVPEMPGGENGETPDGAQPDMGMADQLTLSDLAEDDIVSVVLDDDGNAATITVLSFDGGGMDMNGGMGGPGGMGSSAEDLDYTAVNEYSEDAAVEGESISSTGTDENAVLVTDQATVTLSDATVDRTSAESTGGDNSSFYGIGAAVLAKDGTVSVTDSTITTDAAGGAGVFAYGDGTAYVSDSTIVTQQDTSGGIHAAGGGTLYAWDLNVTTNGGSAAAIRSDRGGGTMVIDGGSYTSNGYGSPAVYCTADIAVNNADLTATGSEAVCIEGLNTLNLYDCNLSGTMSDDSQNDCTWTVIVYQSMSGDSEIGNGTFAMDGGTLTSGNGGLFYTTNTECTITLKDVEIQPSDTNAFFLRCSGNNNLRGWGTSGNNGSDCLFTAIEQEMTGDVLWDSISQLDFYLTEGSQLTGAVMDDETYAGSGGSGFANLYIDAGSTWIVTGDSTLTSLYNEGTILDEEGNEVSVIGVDGTEYVSGTSAYTITVESYSDTADVSGASSISAWSDHAVEKM